MKFFINDHCFETLSTFTMLDLITYLNLKNQPIAIEKNKLFIPKMQWSKTNINNFDKLNVIEGP